MKLVQETHEKVSKTENKTGTNEKEAKKRKVILF